MKAQIQDRAALQTVRASDLTSYLRSQGWTLFRELPERMTVWRLGEGDDAWEVAVPAPGIRDYAESVAQLLKILEEAEARSQLALFRDISTAGSDLLRIPLMDAFSGDGTLAVESGVAAHESARELLLAAACSAVQARPAYLRRRPAEATDYMKHVRLGQTEVGSFVLTLVSPVPPRLLVDEAAHLDEPFERRVTRTLVSGIAAATSAARAASAKEDLEPFRQAVEQGVSANLCDALASLIDSTSAVDGLGLELSWARHRLPPQGSRALLRVPREVGPTMREAARLFRQITPRDAFELEGYVYKLERGRDAEIGRVFVAGVVDERSRVVELQLGRGDYELAIRAHESNLRLSCVGELVREGKSFELRQPRELGLLTAET